MTVPASESHVDVAIVGAGIAGIATAWYLSRQPGHKRIALIDMHSPMSMTSAVSGENFRNWWPHPVMTGFIDRSLDLLGDLARRFGGRLRVTADGYALASRRLDADALVAGLHRGYATRDTGAIRDVDGTGAARYLASLEAPATGVDVIRDASVIRRAFPAFDPDVRTVVHVRRAGRFDSQQLGQAMLETLHGDRFAVVRGKVTGIDAGAPLRLSLSTGASLDAGHLVVAAGPLVNDLLGMLGESIPVTNVLQQKLAFEDRLNAIPRNQPFAVDLDAQHLDFAPGERALLAADPDFAPLAEVFPGGVHRRPDGARWVRLGWAYNTAPGDPVESVRLDDAFPEIALRGAARLNPALRGYYDSLPAARRHYAGWYTMTAENLPLIGPMSTPGVFVVGALSGFGTMAACAAGELCARHVTGAALPADAPFLSRERYGKRSFLEELRQIGDRGLL